MQWVGMFSGGAGSWAACKRAAAHYGPENGVLLFADTKVEDGDLYRFLPEAAANIGVPLVRVCDGRTPFQVFHDVRFLGNTRRASCSLALKIEPCRRWMTGYRRSRNTLLVLGIGWDEVHRLPAIRSNWVPYRVWAPLTEPPYLDPSQVLTWMRESGLRPPAAYKEGFPHNNCLEQGCVKGGQTYWRHLLKTRPEVYCRTEAEEEDLRRHLGKDVAVLRDRRGGKTLPLPLAEFRHRMQADGHCDSFEWGGCGCFTDTEEEKADHE
jgi:hypothetical protein